MEEKMTLMQRILKITNELKVKKNGKNTFSKYDYFKLEDIVSALNPLLAKYDVFMHYDLTQNEITSGKEDSFHGVLSLVDAISPDNKIEYVADIEKAEVKGASGIQMSGATLTYGKRQAIMNAFNLAEEDDDPNSDVNDKKNPKNASPQATVKVNPLEEKIDKTIKAFRVFAVSRELIEKKIGKPMNKFSEENWETLTADYQALKAQTKTKLELFGQ